MGKKSKSKKDKKDKKKEKEDEGPSAKQIRNQKIFKIGVTAYKEHMKKNKDSTKKMSTFIKEAFAK